MIESLVTRQGLQFTQKKGTSGFALVLSLTLMAFTLLLLLSMTAFIRVEEYRSRITIQESLARQSARMALYMAIGQLQAHAGPDQRVSARREIEDASAHPFWTGIWNTAEPEAEPVWLVSGQSLSSSQPNTPFIRIVSTGTVGLQPENYVDVPALKLPATEHTGPIEIGWWTSDQGVKASIGEMPTNLQPPPNYANSLTQQNWQTQLSTTPGLEELFTDYDRHNAPRAVESWRPCEGRSRRRGPSSVGRALRLVIVPLAGRRKR